MSNEFEDQAVNKILDLSDVELLDYVEVGLVNSNVELSYELPTKVREALQTLAYDIYAQQRHIISTQSITEINSKCNVEILRKRYISKEVHK